VALPAALASLTLCLPAAPVPVESASRPPVLRATFAKLRLVGSVAVSPPDGQRIATGCWLRDGEGLVKWWDWPGGKERPALASPAYAARHVVFSPDGKLLAAAGQDRLVRVWDAHTGRSKYQLEGHGHAVWALAFSPDGRLLASSAPLGEKPSIILWDLVAGKPVHTLGMPKPTGAYSLTFSPDGRLLAGGGGDGLVRLWDPASGKELTAFAGQGPDSSGTLPGQNNYTGGVWSVAFSPDGQLLASGGTDGAVRLWDVAARKQLVTLPGHRGTQQGHTGDALALAFSPDGRWLASGGSLPFDAPAAPPFGEVVLYSVAGRREVVRFAAHNGPAKSVAFVGPDGAWLATSGTETDAEEDKPAEGTVKVWQLRLPAAPGGAP
jgi:WD40 repeat protein